MSEPIKKVLDRLDSAKKSSGGWKARCPAHDDRNPSLSVSEAANGTVLLKCHAGCSFEEVIGALGLEPKDLYPSNGSANGRREIVATYPYTDESGDLLFQVVRKQGKQFRQRQPDGSGGWKWNLKGVRRVLYRLPAVLEAASTGRVVFVTEGEKDVHTLEAWGFVATTNPMGAGIWQENYSKALKGARVVILPDNDREGKKHARKVARSVFGYARSVRIVDLPDLSEKGDVSDWAAAGGTAKELQQLVKETPALERPPGVDGPPEVEAEAEEAETEAQPPDYVPFPVEALPAPAADYVLASAKALPCAEAMIAVPMLSVLASAVGAAAEIQLKSSWREPSPLWTMLCQPSGSIKSSAVEKAAYPIFQLIQRAGEEPEESKRRRYRVDDTTVEAVCDVLSDNPRGLLLYRDEQAGWLGSFDRYAKGEADMQSWIAMYEVRPVAVDRKTTKSAMLPRPAVSVCGTIQPGTLRKRVTEQHIESGFLPRIQMVSPPARPKRFTEHDVTPECKKAYAELVEKLFEVPMGTTLNLSREAKELFAAFVNANGKEVFARDEGPARSVAAKTDGLAARLALVLHLARQCSEETTSTDVDAGSMNRALTLAKWLRDETLRVYEALGLAEEVLPPEQRFLRKLPDEFKTAEAEALSEDFDVEPRTVRNWLRKLVEQGDLEKPRRGFYRKTYPASSFRSFRNLHKEGAGSRPSVKKTEATENGNLGNAPEARPPVSTNGRNGEAAASATPVVLEAPTVRWAHPPTTDEWLAER